MLGDLMMLLGVIFIFLGFLCRRYRNIHAKYKGQAEATVVEIVVQTTGPTTPAFHWK